MNNPLDYCNQLCVGVSVWLLENLQ